MNTQQKKALKKKSSSLGVELKPLIHHHEKDTSNSNYGSPGFPSATDDATHPITVDEYSAQQNRSEEGTRSFQLLRRENLAIPACYLCVGLMQGVPLRVYIALNAWKAFIHSLSFCYSGFSRPLLNVYPLDLGATEAQQTTIFSVAMLPCTFKILFGFVSDQFPFWGMRRKGYMWIGWSISTISMLMLLLTCNLSMDWNSDGKVVPPKDAPSVQQLSLAFLLFGTGFWMADVMGDSIVAERAKLEPFSSKGQLQSTCYACRFFGMMVAAPISTVLYNSHYGPRNIVLTMAIIPPVIMGPLIYLLEELPPTRILSAKDQCTEIWAAVCSRAVWQPMGFVSTFYSSISPCAQDIKTLLSIVIYYRSIYTMFCKCQTPLGVSF